jgi:type VI protein secretion system component Hcp
MAKLDAYLFFNAQAKGRRVSDLRMAGETKDKQINSLFTPAPIELLSYKLDFSIDPRWIKKEQQQKNNMVPVPRFGELEITKQVDTASPGMFLSLCNAGLHNEVKLVQRRSGGSLTTAGEIFIAMAFKHVVVVHVDWGVGENGVPIETARMKFDTIEIEYLPQESSGGHSASKKKKASWTLGDDDSDMGLDALFSESN